MAKIKLSNLRFTPIIDYVRKKFHLTWQQAGVYGFFFNHCQNINDDGWCGYSDEYIAKELELGVRTLQRELETLKSKNLITVKNSGKRTKRTGQSRMIYLNTEIFIEYDVLEPTAQQTKEQDTEKDRKIEQLEAELNRVSAIAKRVEELEAAALPNAHVQRFIEAKYIKKADIPRAVAELNDLYKAFMFEFGVSELEYHIDYMMKELEKKEVKNVVSYLSKAVSERSKYLATTLKQEKITKNPNKEDWLDRMNELNKVEDDAEETAKMREELAEMMAQIVPNTDTTDENVVDDQLQFKI